MSLSAREVPAGDDEAIRAAARELLAPVADRLAGDRLTLVPDCHYPYHPSTGLVTDPVVVEALLEAAREHVPGVDLVVAVADGRHVGAERSARYLGYGDVIERTGARFVALDDAPRTDRVVEADGRRGTVSVPRPLVEGDLLAVPTARTGRTTRLAGATVTLARAASAPLDRPDEVIAAVEALAPVGAVLDATYTFTAEPHAADLLIAGASVATVDRGLARLFGLDAAEEPYLDRADGDPDPATVVDGDVSLAAVAADIPEGSMPDSREPHSLARLAYRAYTVASGDAYPPQLLDER